ncbi:MAG: DUF1822 family protein, partial [Cyanobacteria bacterium J06621_11]
MTANLLDTEDFDSLLPILTNTVELTESSLQWATDLSSSIPDNSSESVGLQQWQRFLEGLAIAGFRQWLNEGAIALPNDHIPPTRLSDQSVVNEFIANQSVANFSVGSYRLHIAAINTLSADALEVPVASANSEFESALADLYVIADVREEIDQVHIIAGLWREQLIQSLGLSLEQRSQTISIPLSAFTVEPEHMLLCLSCLEPVPVAVTSRASAMATAQTAVDGVIGNVINARDWLQGQVDAVVEQMRWTLLPPISPAMRPVRDTVDAALEALALQGVQLPLQARGIGGPISLGSQVCQVYTWAWPIEVGSSEMSLSESDLNEPDLSETDSEWTLFLLL